MPATLAKPAVIRPQPGESQVAFYCRANKALKPTVNRVEKRTELAHKMWIDQGGERELQSVAREKFGPDKFTRIASRPVFAEHTLRIPSKGGDGRPTVRVEKYDRAALQSIVDACNHRILDTGDFPPLTRGHTPSEEAAEQGAPQPDVLGYCGPFRLGIIGNKSPRWAIFQDEWIHNEHLQDAAKLARRSPEVWSDSPMAERIMDPVAALGAETPRLDLGMSVFHFSRTASGRTVTKYSAATVASGSNTFPPAFGDSPSKRRYAAGADEMADPTGEQNVDHGLVQAVVAALMQTAPMQWVAQQMQASEQAQDDGIDDAIDGDGAPAGDVTDVDPAVPTDAPPVGEPAGETVEAPADESDMDDEERRHYSAIPAEHRPSYLAGRAAFRKKYEAGGGPTMYSRGRDESNKRLQTQVAELQRDLSTLQKNDRYSRRRNELADLSRNFAFELETEFAETRDLPADQWDTHKKRIATRYSRKPNPEAVPDLHIDAPMEPPAPRGTGADSEKQKYHRQAMDLIDQSHRTRNGKVLTYDEALAQVKPRS